MPFSLPDLGLIWLTANVLTFVIFGWDKIAAQFGWSRVRERTLLILTLAGGLGAMAASAIFRHKTRKQPFRRYAVMLAVAHLVFTSLIFIYLG